MMVVYAKNNLFGNNYAISDLLKRVTASIYSQIENISSHWETWMCELCMNSKGQTGSHSRNKSQQQTRPKN